MTNSTAEERDPGVQLIVRLAATLLLWAATQVGANLVLASETTSVPLRSAAAVAGVVGVLPWIWMSSRAILREDEFTRRIHFVALSWAFAATGVFVYAVDLLTKAHFIGYASYTTIWIFMVLAWWISIVVTSRYYR